MTAMNRAQRRALAKEERSKGIKTMKQNNIVACWDDLNNIYGQCVALLQQHDYLGQLVENAALIACVADINTFNTNLEQLATDLVTFTNDLASLYALHSGRTGGSDNPDVLLAATSIHENYISWMTKHDAVVLPTLNYLLEQIQAAEILLAKKLAEQEAAAQAQDVSVVTDVEVRDVVTENKDGNHGE